MTQHGEALAAYSALHAAEKETRQRHLLQIADAAPSDWIASTSCISTFTMSSCSSAAWTTLLESIVHGDAVDQADQMRALQEALRQEIGDTPSMSHLHDLMQHFLEECALEQQGIVWRCE